MLTLNQADQIVKEQIRIVKDWWFGRSRDRYEVVYHIYAHAKAQKSEGEATAPSKDIGTYRVSLMPDGAIRIGWIGRDSTDDEIMRQRDFFHTQLVAPEINRYMQVGNSPRAHRQINLQTRPAGRRVNPWNPAAFDILNDSREGSERRAFAYWCGQQSIKNPGKSERDAFKKAMDRERKRRAPK